jgi:hypothetical protein
MARFERASVSEHQITTSVMQLPRMGRYTRACTARYGSQPQMRRIGEAGAQKQPIVPIIISVVPPFANAFTDFLCAVVTAEWNV